LNKTCNKLICFFLLVILLASCSPTPPPGCADNITVATLSTGLVAYYKFPSSGFQLDDHGGNAYHLSNIGSVTSDLNRASSANCAMRFNGTNYLQATSPLPSTIGPFLTKPFTVELAYKPDGALIVPANTYPILIGLVCGPIGPSILTNPMGLNNFLLGIDSCKVPFSVLSPNAAYSGSPCNKSDSLWHNAAVTWDGSNTMTVYHFTAGGTLYSQVTTGVPLTPGCSIPNTIIGYGLKGLIDDIKIWNRVITSAELSAAMSYDSPCCP
jgi:Concanavalin A-like lectin/glucanases superfamily